MIAMDSEIFFFEYKAGVDFELNPDGTPRTPGRSIEHKIREFGIKKLQLKKDNEHHSKKSDILSFKEPAIPPVKKTHSTSKKTKEIPPKQTSTTQKRKYQRHSKVEKIEPRPKPSKPIYGGKKIKMTDPRSDTTSNSSTSIATWHELIGPFEVPSKIKPSSAKKPIRKPNIDSRLKMPAPISIPSSMIKTEREVIDETWKQYSTITSQQLNATAMITSTPSFNSNFKIPKKSQRGVVNEWYDPSKIIKQEYQPIVVEQYQVPALDPYLSIKVEVDDTEPPVLNIPSPEVEIKEESPQVEEIKNEGDSDDNSEDDFIEVPDIDLRTKNIHIPINLFEDAELDAQIYSARQNLLLPSLQHQ